MTASTTPMTADPGGDVRAKIGLLALLAGTALNMLRMAPIFVSDGFEVDQLSVEAIELGVRDLGRVELVVLVRVVIERDAKLVDTRCRVV